MKVKVTSKQLKVWNYLKNQTFGISFNENWNKLQGLPDPEIRKTLSHIHSQVHGMLGKTNQLTKKEIEMVDFCESEKHLYGKDQNF